MANDLRWRPRHEYRPRGSQTQRFVEHCRADARFPRHLNSRSMLDIYFRQSHASFAVWAAAAEVWRRYVHRRRHGRKFGVLRPCEDILADLAALFGTRNRLTSPLGRQQFRAFQSSCPF